MFGLKADWSLEVPPRYYTLEDYAGGEARWCPGCGDHGVLNAVQRICRDEQIPPEKVVAVSGIGCSSRFPHYMGTYGFHGLHGRALPVACGIKSRRPDLHVWVATGDGDCFSIGAGHWIHAVRYNMDMTLVVFDNNVYGLTKNQTSPTSRQGLRTNTHPFGALLPPHNPLTVTLGITNVSFVAQTVDWHPAHLYATLRAAFDHKGFSFVRVLQRCPQYTGQVFEDLQKDPAKLLLLTHNDGIHLEESSLKLFPTRHNHDPSSMSGAHAIAAAVEPVPVGLLFRDPARPRYETLSSEGLDLDTDAKLAALERTFDQFAV
jgi:2-oxoglutarate ferredoxin oxidoreductase subunit beta